MRIVLYLCRQETIISKIMGTYTTETIVISEPSKKMLDLIERMREHKRKSREEMKKVEPMFTITA